MPAYNHQTRSLSPTASVPADGVHSGWGTVLRQSPASGMRHNAPLTAAPGSGRSHELGRTWTWTALRVAMTTALAARRRRTCRLEQVSDCSALPGGRADWLSLSPSGLWSSAPSPLRPLDSSPALRAGGAKGAWSNTRAPSNPSSSRKVSGHPRPRYCPVGVRARGLCEFQRLLASWVPTRTAASGRRVPDGGRRTEPRFLSWSICLCAAGLGSA